MKHVRRRARFQQHRDTCCRQVFSCKAMRRMKFTPFWQKYTPSYSTVKKWVAQFKLRDIYIRDVPRPGRPKTMNTRRLLIKFTSWSRKTAGRISAKSIAEQLGISHERVKSIIHEDLDMRKLSVKSVPKCLKADQKRHRCQSSEQVLEFFRRDPNDFLSRLVTMDETWLYHYDPETKQ